MGNELISVIVPVYNCELYIEECINSILKQTYSNLEIILIDDGSTDNSGKMCDEFVKKDCRIRVIHQDNAGAQAARSKGIENATGKYIGFIDSDDWIDCDMYEKLHKSIGMSDLATSGFWFYDQNAEIKRKSTDLFPPGKYDCQSQYFCDNLMIYHSNKREGMFGGILNNLVCKLFKTSVVKKCYLEANVNVKIAEDLLFTLIYILNCNEVVITDRCYYHYRCNASSVTHSGNMDFLEEQSRFYKAANRAIFGHLWEKSLRKQLNKRFMYLIYSYTSFKMQMDLGAYYPQYIFPKSNLLIGKRVILFGAGKIGKSFYNDWKYRYRIDIVYWVDNASSLEEIEEYRIMKPKVLVPMNLDYDYIVCAVANIMQAEAMKKQLLDLGFEEEKILWEQPVNIFQKFFIESV